MASPSPPLFPLPQKILNELKAEFFKSHSVHFAAARSIKSIEAIGSCCIVYASQALISSAE
jgi:hypothetical protein